jgi:hypothetical protein
MIWTFRRERAGLSATRRYRTLSKRWRQRTFGERSGLLAFLLGVLTLLVLIDLPLSRHWALMGGVFWGMCATAAWMIPDLVMPSHIRNWQFGAWGEENTASELKRLRRRGWTVRHDVGWGRGNHDHVVADRAVFLLNTKNLGDSSVTIDGDVIRVTRLDDPDQSYLADRWPRSVQREAESLEHRLYGQLGWRAAVYPVIVVWGAFADEPTWIGQVFVVRGDKLVEFLEGRPADLLDASKREQVAAALQALPRAVQRLATRPRQAD